MKRKNTFACISAVICLIVCLQLVNHLILFEGSRRECLCKCDVNPMTTPVPETKKRGGVLHSPVENERRFDENLKGMLELLGRMNEMQQNSLGDRFEQLVELLNSVKDKRETSLSTRKQKKEIIRGKLKAQPAENQEICPEKFMGESLTHGYPFFRKGFATLNCSQHIPIHELVTLIFDDLYTSHLNPSAYQRILKGLSEYHPKMQVVYITQGGVEVMKRKLKSGVDAMESNVKVVRVRKEIKQGYAWSKAFEHVKTKYVLIAPHLAKFDDDINLERLVRILNHNPDVAVVSGAYRTRNGHWDIGCQQSRFINYTLTLQGGYYLSFWDCLVCDVTPGPWLTRKEDLYALKFDESLDFGLFYEIFWRLKQQKRIIVSCPDVMFNIDKPEVKDEQYHDFARKHDIKKIVEPSGRVRWYGCRRGIKHKTGHACSRPRGVGVPPCDLENLADAIKMIMRECEEAGLFCELQEGTLLGAVKFNKVLPWERDADLTFLTANYTAIKALGPKFTDAGYSFTADDSSLWCCADGRKAGGKILMDADGWNIELYGQHLMESEMLVSHGEKPTKVDFAGQMVTVMRNPGLFARNRYGTLLYRHQEHWMDRGKTSGWHFYNPEEFESCPDERHSACLSRYSTDDCSPDDPRTDYGFYSVLEY